MSDQPDRTVGASDVNPRGIPRAIFIENVPDFLGGPEAEAEGVLKSLEETLSKYKFMQTSTSSKAANLEAKVPELTETLKVITVLQEKHAAEEPLETTFELNDTLYARASIPPSSQLYLWLGASTMLAYDIPEALALLTTKLEAAKTQLRNAREDLVFLREQITTTEVNIARVYNFDPRKMHEPGVLTPVQREPSRGPSHARALKLDTCIWCTAYCFDGLAEAEPLATGAWILTAGSDYCLDGCTSVPQMISSLAISLQRFLPDLTWLDSERQLPLVARRASRCEDLDFSTAARVELAAPSKPEQSRIRP
ncbi:uncharacterized protein L969DRAFT_42316 [Mixia osmundae IAM 14324]|uniref:Prefoldin subunit 3 n=1 Tax=Mixia osmundae (strain CBS 9802 / IAM 14324 / JCM 22182 / KY 12970) TaxID=764103 RepID=G7DTA1_MIXOS|nr:uncharacterized protein L969DRAFT_42316 [Mixia osmundae IAM 14324]KEI42914.1 hypothetical protein L969DRAFT_42316 [Mixia osmundae IAM 14324]GAA93748.1 hypothetical protein E5Q_00394 [Mixia osmundae IAM 14324]